MLPLALSESWGHPLATFLYFPWDISGVLAGLAWARCQTGLMVPAGGHGHPVPSAAVGR